jgi:hypothetical protein
MTQKGVERRRSPRAQKTGKVRVGFDVEGDQRGAFCTLMDLSAAGMRIASPERIPVNTTILFQIESPYLHGSAKVRHCTQKGMKFIVGVEFLGGLQFLF